ncbi:MAG: hypothetical protein A3H97_22745 [Acidobacteria bacterium RIFCSPLOWO2_02_FULL_65_29]|nr:MAG: hypothetical protein A3H97_22745 [Acidobacteria bacterium RIFCSPLOWO2_02_FULL_65_29]
MKQYLVISGTVAALTLSLLVRSHAQQQVRSVPVGRTPVIADNLVNGPVPRLADGKPDLTGPWLGGGSDGDMERDGGLKPGELTSVLLPAARALRAKREKAIYEEPYIYCLPMSVPRVNPYPWKFAMSYTSKGLTQIYVLHETGDAGAHRVVYMDGRKHPVDPIPTWWGHSIGRWEGDTLVIDTIGYNDRFWFDAVGTPHTEQLHTIERWTRVNYGTLVNEFTLDDPGAFSKPVQLKFTARLVRADIDLMEYICAENNQIGIAGGYLPNPTTPSPKK